MTTLSNSRTSSRRTFLKSSSATAIGTGLAAHLLAPRYAHADGDGTSTLKIGLVGCGGRGSRAAVQALSTKGRVQLVAMADAFGDQLEGSMKRIAAATKSQGADRVNVVPEKRFVGYGDPASS